MKFILAILFIYAFSAKAQQTIYPYESKTITLTIEQQPAKMSFMDIPSNTPDAPTVLLLHGKNFNGYYWKDVIRQLHNNNYRVVVPDQVGFGKSDKPNIHYSFSMMAENTAILLDTLGITRVTVVGHSMGGMLATRFVLMYPERVDKLIYENPIGLEDYRLFVPYRSVDEQFAHEQASTFASLKNYQASYYPEWKPEYDQYVAAQYNMMQVPDLKTAAWASALTYDMIYQQPVVYEFSRITTPTLIIIGQADRTIVGKGLLSKQVADEHGQYPKLGEELQRQIHGSKLVRLPGVGHIPHIQAMSEFMKYVLKFIPSGNVSQDSSSQP